MSYWFRRRCLAAFLYLLVAGLVAGGLAWVTANALQLEEEQRVARAQAKQYEDLRLGLWRLDGRINPILAREDSRPYNHFSAVYAPALALRRDGMPWQAGTVLELSPLVNADLPDWILLHFQTDAESGWGSPQILSESLARRLGTVKMEPGAGEVKDRRAVLNELNQRLAPKQLLQCVKDNDLAATRTDDTTLVLTKELNKDVNQKDYAANEPIAANPAPQQQAANQQPTVQYNLNPYNQGKQQLGQAQQISEAEYQTRANVKSRVQQESNYTNRMNNDDAQDVAIGNTVLNGEGWFLNHPRKVQQSKPASVRLGSMAPMWLKISDDEERLVVARMVRIGDKEVCQGMMLDWSRLQEVLAQEVSDLFPAVAFEPVREKSPTHPERTMTALPVQLNPGPNPYFEEPLEWTPTRAGLATAWGAALIALAAVGLGGWGLLDLSERRTRFVSAVTHELRTPLTTLRLYLDMLTGGMVREEDKKAEYLQTLHLETDRLSRLVENVLDFSRLESQRPRLDRADVLVEDLLEQVRVAWEGRCGGCDKVLVVENATDAGLFLHTDVNLVRQVLGNLIDNACKYSRDAGDRHVWLRARREGRRVRFEVEDRGPGVAPRDQRSIFRAFRRGRGTDTTGGVGLGLALARRWAALLGGRLTLHDGVPTGACFRLELPGT